MKQRKISLLKKSNALLLLIVLAIIVGCGSKNSKSGDTTNDSIQSVKENPKLEIRRPRIIKTIEVTGDNVNLRKSPSTNAPKLYRWCEPETDCCGYEWGMPKREVYVETATVSKGEIFAVLSETPEWYEVITHYYGIVAYISKQFTQVKELEEIFPETLSKPDYYESEYPQIPGVQKGEYRGYALIQMYNFEDNYSIFGRIVDGMLVCNWILDGQVSTSEEPGRFEFNQKFNNSSQRKELVIYGCRDVCRYYKRPEEENIPDYPGLQIIDMTKVTSSEFATIMKKAGVKPGKTCDIGLIYSKVNGHVFLLAEYDLSMPEFKGRIMTFPQR